MTQAVRVTPFLLLASCVEKVAALGPAITSRADLVVGQEYVIRQTNPGGSNCDDCWCTCEDAFKIEVDSASGKTTYSGMASIADADGEGPAMTLQCGEPNSKLYTIAESAATRLVWREVEGEVDDPNDSSKKIQVTGYGLGCPRSPNITEANWLWKKNQNGDGKGNDGAKPNSHYFLRSFTTSRLYFQDPIWSWRNVPVDLIEPVPGTPSGPQKFYWAAARKEVSEATLPVTQNTKYCFPLMRGPTGIDTNSAARHGLRNSVRGTTGSVDANGFPHSGPWVIDDSVTFQKDSIKGHHNFAQFVIFSAAEPTTTATATSTLTATTTATATSTLTATTTTTATSTLTATTTSTTVAPAVAAATTLSPLDALDSITSHFMESAGENCGQDDDEDYQPGGNATLNRIIRYDPADSELDHLTKCARKCAEYVVTGNEGCGGFVYEKHAVTDSSANLAGEARACTLRRGPAQTSPNCPDLGTDTVSFYKRMAGVVVLK
ncbi:unnamed protein product [Amoebophrya sp. A25]|nr:unnamed protein product [Amoebophrya sp. A25]|eukprot:GSA25T00010641001.1